MQKSQVGLELVNTKRTPRQNHELAGWLAAAQLINSKCYTNHKCDKNQP